MSEERYWSLSSQANAKGITRSRLGQLAKICQDYNKAYRILSDSLATKSPSKYLGKCIANLKEEIAPPAIHIPRNHEPEIVLQARLRGWPVRKSVRTNGEPAWWVAGVLYDQGGIDVGA